MRSTRTIFWGIAFEIVIGCTPRGAEDVERGAADATAPVDATPPAEATTPAEAAAPTAEVHAPVSCAAIEAEIATVLEPIAKLRGEIPDPKEQARLDLEVGQLRRCLPGNGGAWVRMPRPPKIERYDDGNLMRLEVPYRPLLLRADGRRVAGETELSLRFAPMIGKDIENYESSGTVARLHDYDHDGTDELVLVAAYQAHEDYDETHYVLAATSTGVGKPASLARVDIDGTTDFDADGVGDVVSITTYPGEICFGMYGEEIGVPPLLYHAGPDGVFSRDDEVARAWLAEQCPAQGPAALVSAAGDDQMSWDMRARQNVACARIRGATAESVERRVRSEWATLPTDASSESCGTTLEQLVALARHVPAVTL